MVVVTVSSSVGIKAESSVISEVSGLSISPSDSIVVSTLVGSHVNSDSDSECVSDLVTHAELSPVVGSDSLSSLIEGEPLLFV